MRRPCAASFPASEASSKFPYPGAPELKAHRWMGFRWVGGSGQVRQWRACRFGRYPASRPIVTACASPEHFRSCEQASIVREKGVGSVPREQHAEQQRPKAADDGDPRNGVLAVHMHDGPQQRIIFRIEDTLHHAYERHPGMTRRVCQRRLAARREPARKSAPGET